MKSLIKNILIEQTVFHGSPHNFDEFTMSMFGEGEGASGWGHGLYFTVDEEEAVGYAEKLEREEGTGMIYKTVIPPSEKFFDLSHSLDLNEQTEFIKSKLKKISSKDKIKFVDYYTQNEFTDFKNDIDSNIEEYDFEIGNKEYLNYMDEILNDLFWDLSDFFDTLKQSLSKYSDGEYEASEYLKNLGIKGTKHSSFGYMNYIVFNDSDVEIIEKYSL